MSTQWRRIPIEEWSATTLDALAARLRPGGWVYVGVEPNTGAALFVRYPP